MIGKQGECALSRRSLEPWFDTHTIHCQWGQHQPPGQMFKNTYFFNQKTLFELIFIYVTMRVELVGPAREYLGFSSSRIPPVNSIISSWRMEKVIIFNRSRIKKIWNLACIHTQTKWLTLSCFKSLLVHHYHLCHLPHWKLNPTFIQTRTNLSASLASHSIML